LVCCARGCVVLYRCRGRPPNLPLCSARPHRCAWLSCARKRSICIAVEDTPKLPFSAALGLAAALRNLLRVGVPWCVCVLAFNVKCVCVLLSPPFLCLYLSLSVIRALMSTP
jgi:hypothetical protein